MQTLKTLVTFTLLCLLYQQSTAQQFTVEQLRKFNGMPMDGFKQEIKEVHHYSYADKTTSENFILFEYDNSDSGYRKVGKFDYPKDPSSNSVEYTTADKKEFEHIKNELLTAGYKDSGNGKIPGGETYTDLKKATLQVRLVYPKKTAAPPDQLFTVIVVK